MTDRYYEPGSPGYSIIPAGSSGFSSVTDGAVTLIHSMIELRATIAREEARRAIIETTTNARLEEFRAQMKTLDEQLANDCQSDNEYFRRWFDIADRLVEQGKDQSAIVVLEMISKKDRKSLVSSLIDYCEKITLGAIKLKKDEI